jgi:hypothetical protein
MSHECHFLRNTWKRVYDFEKEEYDFIRACCCTMCGRYEGETAGEFKSREKNDLRRALRLMFTWG